MDLASIRFNDTVDVEITHPVTGDKTGIKITVAFVESEIAKGVQRKQQNERLARLQAKGGLKKTKFTAEMAEEEGLDYLVACTLGWSGMVENGEAIPFSKEAVRNVYVRYPWLRNQIDEAMVDRELFIRG